MNIIKPKLPTSAKLKLITTDKLVSHETYESVRLENDDAFGLNFIKLGFDEATFQKVLFVGSKLDHISLMDTEFSRCDLSAAKCVEASVIRTRFVGGRMTGVDFSRSALKDVIFENCKLDMANFRFAKLTNVQFVDCMMYETDFQQAMLTDVEFVSSDLEKVEFGQCRLKNVDARTSQLYDTRGWQSLRGLTIDSTQLIQIAPELAAEFGISVKE